MAKLVPLLYVAENRSRLKGLETVGRRKKEREGEEMLIFS